jgi:hypothetical protein
VGKATILAMLRELRSGMPGLTLQETTFSLLKIEREVENWPDFSGEVERLRSEVQMLRFTLGPSHRRA